MDAEEEVTGAGDGRVMLVERLKLPERGESTPVTALVLAVEARGTGDALTLEVVGEGM